MTRKKLLSLLLVAVLLTAIFAGCSNNNTGNTSNTSNASTTASSTETDFYKFSQYCSYDWWPILTWGNDEVSKYWQAKFNMEPVFSKPDANADEVLNLMISSGDLPECIFMDRGAMNVKMAQLGLFVDLDTLKTKVNNTWYDDNVPKGTQGMLKVDGKLYAIPHWVRLNGTGGNNVFMYTKDIYEAAGSPELKTFEDLYAYACNVRDNVKTSPSSGQPVIPYSTKDTGDGSMPLVAFYRSMGAPFTVEGAWYGRVNGTYQMLYRDPVFRAAALEVNKWYREGLLSPNIFTNNGDQWLEEMTNARVGLMWYDFSQDDANKFRSIVRQSYPGNSIELVETEQNGKTYLYLPANGLSYDQIQGEHYNTLGWYVACITTKAKQPERIFDFYSYMFTKESSIVFMYGPKGELWDELDANGNPILKQDPDSLPVEEKERLGLWKWVLMNHADNIDTTKFAVNDAQPEDKRSWVISTQAHKTSPLMVPLTDEYENINTEIPPTSDLNVKRTLCEDYIKAQTPKIIMASSADEANALIDDIIAFCDANGMKDIEAVYDAKYQANCVAQGGSIYAK